jgi:hypothetical protein
VKSNELAPDMRLNIFSKEEDFYESALLSKINRGRGSPVPEARRRQ